MDVTDIGCAAIPGSLIRTRSIEFDFMAGAGFFLDDMIRGVVRHVRRERRISRAKEWSIADGRIIRFRITDGAWHQSIPTIDYAYDAKGETHYGSAAGNTKNVKEIEAIAECLDRLPGIRVRYDTLDPPTNRLLNEDNPGLPFWIDHNVF